MKILLVLLVVAAVVYFVIKSFTSKKKEVEKEVILPPFNPNPDGLQPKGDPQKEPDYIYQYAGEIINRDGKTYKWDVRLGKYLIVL